MRSPRWIAIVSLLSVGATSLASASTPRRYQPPGTIQLVSVGSRSEPPNSFSIRPSLSADGRFVAFFSWASNLVPDDTNEGEFVGSDVFVRDTVEGTTERVSVSSSGHQGNGNSYISAVSLSSDGRYVVFESSSSDLVSDDTNGTGDIFVHDRATRETRRVSVSTTGGQANGLSWLPAISGDGTAVVFWSRASNLVPGDSDADDDLYVHDLTSGETDWISHAPDGSPATPHWSFFPECLSALSHDARRVVFCSESAEVVADDTNEAIDVFVHDRSTGANERVSLNSYEIQGNYRSGQPAISHDGRHVAFFSGASNLVPGDLNSTYDVFVRDLERGTTERVSVSSAGVEADYPSYEPAISEDGRYVGFDSPARTLVPGTTDVEDHVFVHDRLTRQTEIVSVLEDGTLPDGWSMRAALTPDARFVGFDTSAANLVPPGYAAEANVVLADRGTPLGVGTLRARPADEHLEVSGTVRLTGGEIVTATDPVDDDALAVGGDLSRARLLYRPEEADLLVQLEVADLLSTNAPPVPDQGAVLAPGVAGTPGLVYGFRFLVGGLAYEVRATLLDVRDEPRVPSFTLFRCEEECSAVTELEGGFGTVGQMIQMALPLDALDTGEGAALTEMTAFTEVSGGLLDQVDEVVVGDARVPETSVRVGTVASGDPGEEGSLRPADLAEGRFSVRVPIPAEQQDLLVRVCIGEDCRDSRRPVEEVPSSAATIATGTAGGTEPSGIGPRLGTPSSLPSCALTGRCAPTLGFAPITAGRHVADAPSPT